MRHLAAMIALLAACGDNLAGPLAIDDYPAAVREAACRMLARCGEVESLPTCLTTNIGLTVAFTPGERAAIDTGKIAYSGLAARSCVDAIAGGSCDITSQSARTSPDACLAILAGQLHGGEVCAFDEECSSRQCDVPACGMACCPGTCVGDGAPARAQIGASCRVAACAAGSFCDAATVQCAAVRAGGAACNADDECPYGLVCAGHTCSALPGLGEACTFACRDSGTTCRSTTHTCVAVGLVGATCEIGADPSDCSPIYICDRSAHCSAGTPLGQPCQLADQCADDQAVCDTPVTDPSGVCALPKPDGALCARDAVCQSLYCDPFVLTCGQQPSCL